MVNEDEPKVWNLANLVIIAMATIIAGLVSAGFWSMNSKIEAGDTMIYSRLSEIKVDVKAVNDCIMTMQKEITRIDTLQRIRIERENREDNRRNGVK
jgi:hypothetical protein